MVIKYGAAPKRFQSKWDTTQAGSANDTVVLPLVSDGSYNFRIDWGDGKANRDNITVYNQSEVTHQYDDTGIYTIKIVGDITGWLFNSAGDDDKITEISKWGPLKFVSNDYDLFEGCSNLTLTATDSLTLNNARQMFYDCRNLGSTGNMNSWDASNCTNMFRMFGSCDDFNQPIGSWDPSNVTTMGEMFYLYRRARAFDQDIGNWDVGNVTNMDQMFSNNNGSENGEFNNGGSPSISGWNTSNVTDMSEMFLGCYKFNQPIGSWDTSGVTTMRNMLRGCSAFNQPISGWDTSSCTDMISMFQECRSFNQYLGSWDVGNVTNMYKMFYNCTGFIGDHGLSGWDTSSSTSMGHMFISCTGFDEPIGSWDTSSVTNMSYMFYVYRKRYLFNQDIGNWDVGNVTNMRHMFSSNNGTFRDFNNGGSPSISGWDTSSCTNMEAMFVGNKNFNQPIGSWDTSGVTTMNSMLHSCTGFNQPIGDWDITSCTTLNYLLHGATTFNNGGSTNISGWDTSNVAGMANTFLGCTGFNQPIGNWDTSGVTTMGGMFSNCHSFNQDISSWDTSSVTNMQNMFYSSRDPMPFNQDIGGWDVSKVTSMRKMFLDQYGGASHAFNNGGSDSIKDWNTSSLTDIREMFAARPNPSAFDQPLTNWIVTGITDAYEFLKNQNLSTTNYDSTLSGWHSQAVQNGVNISFGGSQYSTATGLAYRNALVASGWTITDGGAA